MILRSAATARWVLPRPGLADQQQARARFSLGKSRTNCFTASRTLVSSRRADGIFGSGHAEVIEGSVAIERRDLRAVFHALRAALGAAIARRLRPRCWRAR